MRWTFVPEICSFLIVNCFPGDVLADVVSAAAVFFWMISIRSATLFLRLLCSSVSSSPPSLHSQRSVFPVKLFMGAAC